MPKSSNTPPPGGTNPLVPKALKPKKPGLNAAQSRLPQGLKQLPGGGKGGKPPRFPGRAGGR